MRMAADHLVGHGLHHIAEIEQPGFLGHAGVEHDLEQQIAQFAGQRLHVVVGDGAGDFVSFLDGVRRDGREKSGRGPRDNRPAPAAARMTSSSTAMSRLGLSSGGFVMNDRKG